METTCQQIHLRHAIQDLKVKLHNSTILFPIEKPERKICFLSNLEKDLNFYISSIHFFAANPEFPVELVIQRLKTAVEKVLVAYDFVAGKVQSNHQSGRREIDCDASGGAGFVVASSEFSLDEIGDLVYPHQGYSQLAVKTLILEPNNSNNNNNQPLCILQVTSFKCGGFSLGWSTNHLILDGMGAKIFFENVASQAFENKPLAFIPNNDRHLLAARSPPRVEYSHPEYILPENIPVMLDYMNEELVSKIFKVTSSHINYLKDKAKLGAKNTTKITTFNVVAALIWRCKALSVDAKTDRVSTLHCVVDFRSKILNPPLPPSYCGNAIIYTYASLTCLELENALFSELVGKISDGINRVTDEYVRSTLDWLEINKGVPCGEYFISSWLKLGFEQVMYPWGTPIYSFPLIGRHNNRSCFFLPPNSDDVIVNVLVALSVKEMETFQSLFQNFFKC